MWNRLTLIKIEPACWNMMLFGVYQSNAAQRELYSLLWNNCTKHSTTPEYYPKETFRPFTLPLT